MNSKRIIIFCIQSAILLFLGFLVTQSIGLGLTGFDTEAILGQFNFYIVSIGFMLGIALLFVAHAIIRKGDTKYGDSIAFASPGENPSPSFFKRFSSLQIFFLSVILFGISGLFFFISRMNSFTGIAHLEQQFTPQAQLLFSSLLIPISENLGSAFVIAMCLFGLGFYARKIKMSSTMYKMLAILAIPILCGFYGVTNHLLRYGGQDIAIIVVFFFWYIGGLITIFSGSFIPFWVMHISNNAFFDMQTLFVSDVAVTYIIGTIAIFVVAYIVIFRKRLFGKSNTQSESLF